MNIYDATMKAADHIEARPDLWSFMYTAVPKCGAPACALGWIGHFAGISAGKCIWDVADLLEIPHTQEFYNRMRNLSEGLNDGTKGWMNEEDAKDLQRIAKLLRLYADKYLKQDHIPESVREIFDALQATPKPETRVER